VRRDGDEGDVVVGVVGVVGEHAGGELVTFPASVNRTSRTSMEIGVRVATQDLVSQVVRHTNSGYFTVVAVGPVGDRLRSPPWQPSTAEERRGYGAAGRRRQLLQGI
jgi:acyl-CoA hydrolase